MLFRDRPLGERMRAARAARDAGFDAVEFWDRGGATPQSLAAAATGLQVVSGNAPAGDLAAGGLGLSGVPGRKREFENDIRDAAEVADATGCPRVHVSPCRLAPGASRDAALSTLERNLKFAADTLGQASIEALIEPINGTDIPGVLVNSLDTALEAMDRVEHPNLRLQFDFYHVGQTDPDAVRRPVDCFARISHVQIADFPGRGAPGTGHLDFAAFLGTLETLGYDG
jgi:hydroxypyruvate isomerase